MGIGISSRIFDVAGARYFADNELDRHQVLSVQAVKRRASRTATLDGGATVYDAGYAVADRDAEIRYRSPDVDVIEYFRHICTTYNVIALTTPEGAFEVVPESFRMEKSDLVLSILFLHKLS